MQFIPLEKEDQLKDIKSSKGYNVVFKHNPTCPISKGARRRFEAEAENLPNVQSVYVVDIQSHREISDAIEAQFNVEHQSPQLLLIKDGECTYSEAKSAISAQATAEAIAG